MKLIIRWMLLASALVLLAQLDIGVQVQSFPSALWAAFVIGLLNAFVRPLLILLTLPVTVLTLGLFLFVVNGLMLMAASRLLDLSDPRIDWVAVAGGLGVPAERVESAEAFDEAMSRAMKEPGPWFIEAAMR